MSNHSSGKQGFALASAAAEAGARVTLISGPVNLATPAGVDRVDVTTAREMLDAGRAAGAADVLIAVAAVADFRPATVADQKIKKQAGEDRMSVELVANPDIVATLTSERPNIFTVAFAAETEHLIAHARRKLVAKGVNMIVANDVSDTSIGFGSETNRVTVIDAHGEHGLPHAAKAEVARSLISLIAERLAAGSSVADPGCDAQPLVD
jgi:phosphopantothenoylcysteine decarboxylase/phosphopantothenate--cysteine ligase